MEKLLINYSDIKIRDLACLLNVKNSSSKEKIIKRLVKKLTFVEVKKLKSGGQAALAIVERGYTAYIKKTFFDISDCDREERALKFLGRIPSWQQFVPGFYERGTDFIIMEYIPGKNLYTHITGSKLGNFRDRLYMLFLIAKAIQFLHLAGITHSDIKAENIMITRRKEIKLIDFGMARFINELHGNYTCSGSLYYISPEAICREKIIQPEKRDIWAFGVLVYEIFAGVVPFGGTRNTIYTKILNIDYIPLKSKRLSAILDRCFQRNPEDRADIHEIVKLIEKF